jgi:hypothetical protein
LNQKTDNDRNARPGAKSFCIEVMSLSRLGNIRLGDRCAVISISSPGNIPYVDFPPHTLQLTFSDLENPCKHGTMLDKLFMALGKGQAGQLGELYWRCRNEVKQAVVPFRRCLAESIYHFVAHLPASIETLYIHCDFGKSRSPAVGVALQRLFGCEVVFKEQNVAPNTFVTKVFADVQARYDWVKHQ